MKMPWMPSAVAEIMIVANATPSFITTTAGSALSRQRRTASPIDPWGVIAAAKAATLRAPTSGPGRFLTRPNVPPCGPGVGNQHHIVREQACDGVHVTRRGRADEGFEESPMDLLGDLECTALGCDVSTGALQQLTARRLGLLDQVRDLGV